jgi:rapamycin-insensitive companion of mTOR
MVAAGSSIKSEAVLIPLRSLLEHKDTLVRGSACRVIKHLLTNVENVKVFIKLRIHFFLIKLLERIQEKGDKTNYLWERIQAFKIVKKIFALDPQYLPPALAYSLVCIASEPKDKLYRVCLEALRELLVLNTRLATECDVQSTLFQAILDPTCNDMASSYVISLMYVLDNPATRKYLKADLDLEIFISCLTNVEIPPDADRQLVWTVASSCLVSIMRSWAGTILLTADKDGLPALIDFLNQPVDILARKAVLKCFYEVLGIDFPSEYVLNDERETLDWLPSYKSKFYENSASYNNLPIGSVSLDIEPGSNQKKDERNLKAGSFVGHNLIHNYVGMLLSAFVHNGLVESLSKLVVAKDTGISRISVILIREVLRLCSAFLSQQQVAQLLSLPNIVSEGVALTLSKSIDARSKGVRAMGILNALPVVIDASNNVRSGSLGSATEIMMEMNDDDLKMSIDILYIIQKQYFRLSSVNESDELRQRAFRSCLSLYEDSDPLLTDLIKSTKVLAGKDWIKWDWKAIQDILDNQLKNSVVFTEVLKGKFLRRLGGFFRCDTLEKGATLAGLPWFSANLKYVQAMLSWFQIMMRYDEGISYLQTDRRGMVLAEICDQLKTECVIESEGKTSAPINPNRLFHVSRFPVSMVREYLTVIKLLTSSPVGVKLVENSKFFELVHDLPKIPGREALIRLILLNLNMNTCNQARLLVAHWFKISSPTMKVYIITIMKENLCAGRDEPFSWGIDILLEAISEGDKDLINVSLNLLEEVSINPRNLEIINMKLGEEQLKTILTSQFLFLRIAATQSGLALLTGLGLVVPEIQKWISGDDNMSIRYALNVDCSILCGLNQKALKPEAFYSPSGLPVEPIPIPVPLPETKTNPYAGVEWFMRLPWAIEVQVLDGDNWTVVPIDTFVDISYTRSPWVTDKPECSIRIKGLVVNDKRERIALSLPPESSLKVCLFFGGQCVDRDGKVRSDNLGGDWRPNNSTRGMMASNTIAASRSFPNLDLDWSRCGPDSVAQAFDSGRYEFIIPGEKVLWTFQPKEEGESGAHKLLSVAYTVSFKTSHCTFVPMPCHLYGELGATPAGCEMLLDHGDIFNIYLTAFDTSASTLSRRAALWSLGHIGSTACGYSFLKEQPATRNLTKELVNLCRDCEWLSLRGTCCQVLGLLSRCSQARLELIELGWSVPMRECPTVVTPAHASSFFAVHCDSDLNSSAHVSKEEDPTANLAPPLPPLKHEWKSVLKNISYLFNNIQQTDGHTKLINYKKAAPKIFESCELFLYVHETILSKFKLPMRVRRFLMTSLFAEVPFKNESVWKAVDGIYSVSSVNSPTKEDFIIPEEGTAAGGLIEEGGL